MVNIVFKGVACADCTCWISNADDSGVDYYGDDYYAKWRAGVEQNAVPNAVIGDRADENYAQSEFKCDYCGLVQISAQYVLVGFEPTCRDLGEQLCGTDRCVCEFG